MVERRGGVSEREREREREGDLMEAAEEMAGLAVAPSAGCLVKALECPVWWRECLHLRGWW